MEYQFKTAPYAHQVVALERTAREPAAGLLMQQRTGKTKVVIDTSAVLHSEGHIDALFVVAPNGVHRNWLTEEIPIHLPDWVQRHCVLWTGADTKKQAAALEALFNPGTHLRVFAMNIEAISTKRGYEFAKRVLNSLRCLWVIDESTRIKTYDTVTVQNIMKLRDKAPYRRILNGTPVTEGPLDLFSQLMFLSDDAVPVQSYVAFRNRYAEFAPADDYLVGKIMRDNLRRAGRWDLLNRLETGELPATDFSLRRWVPLIPARDENGAPKYKNLDELQSYVDKWCYRVLRKDCGDIPEKLYKRWTVEYPEAQRKVINMHLNNLRKGFTPQPVNKLTAVMLYQRLLCGLVPRQLLESGVDEPMFEKPEDNPRLQAILDIAEEYRGQPTIIWARFRRDLHEISTLLEKRYEQPVARYWGDISGEDREEAKQGFQAGKYRFFVGQQGAGGVGLPLHAAEIMVYHSNTFSLYHRLQSEDRAENLAKKIGTLVIDLETPGTVDGKIIGALRNKQDVADLITGDESTEWLR